MYDFSMLMLSFFVSLAAICGVMLLPMLRLRLAQRRVARTEAIFTIGEIIAWRVWWYQNGHLRSVVMRTIWTPREPLRAATSPLTSPYGVFAWRERKQAMRHAHALVAAPHEGRIAVIGSVALWGDVMEHKDGYRAEFAKIVSLDAMVSRVGVSNSIFSLLPLRATYGVSEPDLRRFVRKAS